MASTAEVTAPPMEQAKDTPSIILPPPEIRSIVDKTASFVAKSPKPEAFEDKMRARQATDSRFAFMNKEDAYHAYYQDRLAAFRAGEVAEAKTDEATVAATKAAEEADQDDGRPTEPPSLEFLVEQPPPMNAVDLDILRLTALFTARSGRRFTSELASRENRNYQFDFLRPSHSLFGYFNRLTEQYTKILIPSKEAQARLERRSGGVSGDPEENALLGRREVLKDVKERVEWEKWESSRRQEQEDAAEAERIAFAEIDWQDFVVVSTVEFTEGDEAGLVELPPPMSISEVENMTIAQKKMAAMIMEGREDELAEDEKRRADAEDAEMELDDGEDEVEPTSAETELEKERKRVTEIRAAESSGTRKIRKDYVPKSKRVVAPAQVLTTFGDQQVPVEEFAEHVRIELLDPRWKEAKRQSEANRSAANLLPGGTDVSASIRALAAHRPDIFGASGEDEARKEQEAQALAQSKAREKVVWDGHTATKEAITARFAGESLDEQIEGIRRRKGLVELDEANRIGPAAPAPGSILIPEQPAPASFISGATFSAAPQPNQMNVPYSQSAYSQNSYSQSMIPPPPPPPMPYMAPDSMTSTNQPIANLPSRPAVVAPGEVVAGGPSEEGIALGRPAPDGSLDEPSAKRQRTAKREDGSYWPEQDWIASHPDPITLHVQLPVYADKPEWGCDGRVIELSEISLTLLVSTLRDRIHAQVDLPISKQKLILNGRILQNTNTLAALNFEGGETITLGIKGVKK